VLRPDPSPHVEFGNHKRLEGCSPRRHSDLYGFHHHFSMPVVKVLKLNPYPLQQILEFLNREARIANNASHGISINRIVPWDRKDSRAIRHDNVFALANDAKVRLLQGSHGIKVIYAGNLAHGATRPHLLYGYHHQETYRLWLPGIHESRP